MNSIVRQIRKTGTSALALGALGLVTLVGSVSAARPVQPTADLTITKTSITEGAVSSGEEVLFLIEVTNSGPSIAEGVVVTDVLGNGLVADESALPQGAAYDADANAVSHLLPDLEPGQTYQIIAALEAVTVEACPIEPGQFRTQTQGGWGAVPNGNNPGAYLHANFSQAFPQGLTIGGGDCNGESITFTSAQEITDFLPHGGPSGILPEGGNLLGQTVALSLSVGLDGAFDDFGSSEVNLADLVICDPKSPAVGMSVGELLDAANALLAGCESDWDPSALGEALESINSNFVDGVHVGHGICIAECAPDLCNQAFVTSETTDPDLSNNQTDVVCVPPALPVADLSIVKSADDDSVVIGDSVLFTIAVTNHGPEGAEGVLVTDTLPNGLAHVACATGNGSVCVVEGNMVIADLGAIATGETVTMEILAQATMTGEVCNVAEVSSTSDDPNGLNDTAQACLIIEDVPVVQPDLVVDVEVSPEEPHPGETIVVTVTVENPGSGEATDVEIEVEIPEGLTSTDPSAESTIEIPVGTIPPGGDITVTVEVTVDEETSGEVCVVAVVTSAQPDSDPDSNTETVCFDVTPAPPAFPDLVMDMSASPEDIEQGQITTLIITAANVGDGDANGVLSVTTLPAGLAALSTEFGVISGEIIMADLGTIPAGGMIDFEIMVQGSDSLAGLQCVETSVTSDVADENPADNVAVTCVNISVIPDPVNVADVQVQISDEIDPISRLSLQTYTILVTNNGPDQAEGVVVTDLLSPQTTLFGVESQSSYPFTISGDELVITIGDMANGETAKILVVVLINADAPIEISNTVTISSTSVDTVDLNNTATEITTTTDANAANQQNLTDAIMKHMLGETTLDGAAYLLHDLNGDGYVDVGDLIITQ